MAKKTDESSALTPAMPLPLGLGRRIAAHRAKLGFTQQELADRLAVSRVAVSHLEAGISEPGERTVALLAGVFKVEPHELVADTAYPMAKVERLPTVVARYTEVELQLALFHNDLAWLVHSSSAFAVEVLQGWRVKLAVLAHGTYDARQQALITAAQSAVVREMSSALAR